MHAPWYVYLIAILMALPCYILWAVGAYGLFRGLISWIFVAEPARPAPSRVSAKG